MFTINLTIIGQIIGFALFVWACMAWIWPPIMSALEERQNKIQDALRKAADAEKNVAELDSKYKQTITNAQKQAKSILDSARKSAEETVAEAEEKAIIEADRIILAANQQITQEKEALKASLQKEVEALVSQAIVKLLSDRLADHKNIDSDFIADKIKQL